MKLLMVGEGLGSESRLRAAVAGLALRGHRVVWRERGDPGLGVAAGVVEPWTGRYPEADVVLGGAGALARVVLGGWSAGAQVMTIDLAGPARRWGWVERWAWGSLRSSAMLDAENRPPAGETLHGIEAEKLATWSTAPPPPEPDPTHPDVEKLERWLEFQLARRDGTAPFPAVFLDRDGTLIAERKYLATPDQVELLPGVAAALRQFGNAGYRRVVVSNQAGVGRGMFPEASVHAAMAQLRRELRREGVELEAIYFCPHAPEAGCDCRKPGTRLLEEAAGNLNLSLRRSVMVGDRLLDVRAGQTAGAAGILVRTGYGREEAAQIAEDGHSPRPEFIAEDLGAVAAWITRQGHAAD